MNFRRLAQSVLALAVASYMGVGVPCAAATEKANVDRVIFLIEYLGADYVHTVSAGAVTNEGEYLEVRRFAATVAAQADDLVAQGASAETAAAVRSFVGLIDHRVAPANLRDLAEATAAHLRHEIATVTAPPLSPDVPRGERLFADACAPCHGATGAGDGPLASGMLPPPPSFREGHMQEISPHHIFAAVRFGIDGTAMPSFDAACTTDETWDIAAYVATLRDNAAARNPTENAAEQLEITFADIGARVLPSVVSVSAYARVANAATSPAPPPATGQWAVASAEDDGYPGFRRTRSASGFVVSADGDILTCSDVLLDRGGKTVDVVAIEYRDGQQLLARVIGIEPTIHLGVIRPEILPAVGLPPIPPVTLGDSDRLRPGHWTIGIGDPAGPATAFGVGVLSSEPTRQCYQENLTSTLIQSSMQIHPEAYGGPMTNIRGEVVGLLVPPPGSAPIVGAPPATFALPMNVAVGIYQSLKVKESRVSPWLGFAVLEMPAARRRLEAAGDKRRLPPTGVFIDEVFAPSPAATIDVHVGDCLVALDGQRLLSVLDGSDTSA